MKKKRIINLIRVSLVLLLITFFNSCEVEEDTILPSEELGAILWTYTDFNVFPEAVDPVSITAPAVGANGTIYVASFDRVGAAWQNAKVHAVNSNGTFKWASPELDGAYPYDPVVGSDGTIYVICSTTIYALSSADGSIIWSYQPPANNNEQHDIGWLTLGNDGQIFFAHIASGAYTRKIYALSNTGQEIWKRDVGWGASNLMTGTGGTLYAYWLGNGDINTFGALDPNSGTTKWSTVLESYARGAAISPDGDIVISQDFPDKLIKLSASSGELVWEIDAADGYPSISPDGSIYMVSSDLYCYNSNGTLKWQSGPYVGGISKTAIDSDGNSYGSITDHGDGNFQVYKPDGSLRWAIPQNMTTLHCPAIGSNNVIYVTASAVPTATIYAIQGDKPLASSGWSRDSGGNNNSRNINLH